MNKVYVVFSVERDNPYSTRGIIGMTDTYGAARHMVSLNEDSFIQCVIQEWDISTMQDLNTSSWNVTLWNTVNEVCVKRVHVNEKAKHENKIITNDYDSYMVLVWANNKEEAIEEARRMMQNEGSN